MGNSIFWTAGIMDAPLTRATLGLVVLVSVALLLHFVARRYVLTLVHAVTRKTRLQWDELLFEHRVPHRAALIIPLLVLQTGLVWVPDLSPEMRGLLHRLASASTFLVGALTVDALLSALHAVYQRLPLAAARPIKSYVQLVKVLVYIVAGIFIVARLADQTPWFFVSGLGAMMAVIMLIFRDTLLSLVASVQLTNNDLIRVGDWIEMPQFAADGDVVDIALNNVRVQNWDRTISVIPTHKFLEHSFRNWRGMQESGGRRIKRAIHVNASTVRFLTGEEIERFSRFALLKDYMARKVRELKEHNAKFSYDPSLIPNARRLTNIGTLRAYIYAYLRGHPKIHQDMTLLVRQLDPTPEGIPIEIYAFVNDIRWGEYEDVQADIFDHILSVVPQFELRVYQKPAGEDLKNLAAVAVGAE